MVIPFPVMGGTRPEPPMLKVCLRYGVVWPHYALEQTVTSLLDALEQTGTSLLPEPGADIVLSKPNCPLFTRLTIGFTAVTLRVATVWGAHLRSRVVAHTRLG